MSGGPPLVSGCCGVSWAADRPSFGGSWPACGGWCLAGRCFVPPGKVVLCGVGGGFLAAVDDDLFGLGCGVAPRDQLVEVVAVALVR